MVSVNVWNADVCDKKREFIQTSDHEGYVKYMNESGEMGFQMVKDENGIWNVSFTPIQ